MSKKNSRRLFFLLAELRKNKKIVIAGRRFIKFYRMNTI